MNKIKLWPLVDETSHALGAHYKPALDKAAKQAGLEPPASGILITVQMFDPHPVASWRLRVRFPYTASRRYDERLQTAARLGFLKAAHEGEYRLTELGRRTVRQMLHAAYAALEKMAPLPAEDLERLAGLLRRLVDASLAAPEPPGKWCIHLSRRLDPGAEAAAVRIDQYFSDLNAYRDDAHLAAWQSHDLSGAAWETLTMLWRGEVKTLDELMRRLAQRGHTREDYEEALNDLLQRGLIREEAGAYALTRQGQALRQKAEQKTDEYFYGPWNCLADGEAEEMRVLLERLRAALAEPNSQASADQKIEPVAG